MNVDDPKLTAYALHELDEAERSAIASATADSSEAQRFIAETRDVARALRSQYRLELEQELTAPGKLAGIHDDTFWSKAGPLAIAAACQFSWEQVKWRGAVKALQGRGRCCHSGVGRYRLVLHRRLKIL